MHPATEALEAAMTATSLRSSKSLTLSESHRMRSFCKALAAAAGAESLRSVDPLEATYPLQVPLAWCGCCSHVPRSQEPLRKPKMDAALATRALVRYSELRHSTADDLKPKDLLGRSGEGLRALLRTCRHHKIQVASELENRSEDVVRIIKAFHDEERSEERTPS